MAFVKIRGQQIQDAALKNNHIAADAAIAESKLAINWSARGTEILASKKVVDYVQVNGSAVGGLQKFDLSAGTTPIIPANSAKTTSDPLDVEGIIVSGTKNVAPVRDVKTGDPIISASGAEVYGRVVFVNNAPVAVVNETLGGTVDGINKVFTFANKNIVSGSETIRFGTVVQSGNYTMDYANGTVTFTTAPASGTVITADYSHDQDGSGGFFLNFYSMESGVETAFTMPAGVSVDWQYSQRFNLQTVNEMFAANEKFVQGAADVTAHLNIEQLAKDIYGPTFSLDRDGNANLARNLVDEIKVQTSGLVNTTVRANAIIDEVVAGRGTFADLAGRFASIDNKLSQEITDRAAGDQAIRDDLASQLVGKGATLVGIHDANAKFTATNVEGALGELEGRLATVEGGGSATGTEVETARTSDLTGAHASLDARLETAEKRFEPVKVEVEGARSSAAKSTTVTNADGTTTTTAKAFASVDARLEEIETDAQADAKSLSDYKTSNDTRVAAVESKNTEQDNRLTSVESKNTEQDTRLTSVESKNTEQDGKITNLETEVVAARSSDAKATTVTNADGTTTTTPKTFANVDARLEEIESDAKADAKSLSDYKASNDTRVSAVESKNTEQDNRLTAVETKNSEQDTRLTSVESKNTEQDTRLTNIETKNTEQDSSIQKLQGDALVMHKYTYQAVGGESQVSLPTGQFYIAGNQSLDVYINGTLQSVSLHYTEIKDALDATKGLGVDFAPEVLVAGDVITFRFSKKASQI